MRYGDWPHDRYGTHLPFDGLDDDLDIARNDANDAASRCFTILYDVIEKQSCEDWDIAPQEYEDCMQACERLSTVGIVLSAVNKRTQKVGLCSGAHTCEAVIRYYSEVLSTILSVVDSTLIEGFEYGWRLPDDVLHSVLDLSIAKDDVIRALAEFPLFNPEDVAARIDSEIARAWKLRRVLGLKRPKVTVPLSTQQQQLLEHIRLHPGQTGKEIAKATGIRYSTLTRHHIPKLRSHGVRNFPGAGYSVQQ